MIFSFAYLKGVFLIFFSFKSRVPWIINIFYSFGAIIFTIAVISIIYSSSFIIIIIFENTDEIRRSRFRLLLFLRLSRRWPCSVLRRFIWQCPIIEFKGVFAKNHNDNVIKCHYYRLLFARIILYSKIFDFRICRLLFKI